MSGVGEGVREVFRMLGMGDPPPEYVQALRALNAAGAEWFRLYGDKLGGLHFEMPDLVPGEVVTGSLPYAITLGWCANEAAKHFVEFVDERTGRVATLLQLQILVHLQQAAAANRQVNATGGEG